jgi:hypothetical protein
MKKFSTQFVECHEAGYQKAGEVKKFKDHPELLPPPWHKAAKTIAEEIKKNPDFGLTPIMCLRFGGECNPRNEQCINMRSLLKKIE